MKSPNVTSTISFERTGETQRYVMQPLLLAVGLRGASPWQQVAQDSTPVDSTLQTLDVGRESKLTDRPTDRPTRPAMREAVAVAETRDEVATQRNATLWNGMRGSITLRDTDLTSLAGYWRAAVLIGKVCRSSILVLMARMPMNMNSRTSASERKFLGCVGPGRPFPFQHLSHQYRQLRLVAVSFSTSSVAADGERFLCCQTFQPIGNPSRAQQAVKHKSCYTSHLDPLLGSSHRAQH